MWEHYRHGNPIFNLYQLLATSTSQIFVSFVKELNTLVPWSRSAKCSLMTAIGRFFVAQVQDLFRRLSYVDILDRNTRLSCLRVL